MLRNSGRQNWTVIRPYITYSAQRLQLGPLEKEHWLFRTLHGRTIVFPKDILSKQTTLTYGHDVARAIRAIIGNPLALGQCVNVAGGEAITWADVLDVYLDVLQRHTGTRPKILFQDLDAFCRWYPSKYQLLYDRLYNRVFDPQALGQYLDVSGLVSAHCGLTYCLEEFLKNQKFREIDWASEAHKDKATDERTAFKEIPRIKHKLKYLIWRNLIITA